ncbi:MAG TPA: GNAT family N-acetyltransferase [Flavobacterium sp.]|nr:GNAT family N-acetyltransferase [Flavobacterium sp.]
MRLTDIQSTKKKQPNCFIIKEQDEICGYIIAIQLFSFEMSGMVMLLDELYVSNQFQGKGIGKKAMTFIKEYAHDKDFKKIVLEVEPHNERAIQLYEKEQFRKHRRDLMLFP